MSATPPRPYDVRELTLATLAAVLVAGIVLIVAILPAEYGIDPTGLGRAMGFAALNEEPGPAVVEEPANDTAATVFEMVAHWRVVGVPLAERKGFVSDRDTEERVTIPIHVTNLTSVTATLTWNDTDLLDGKMTEGDSLEISIRGPDGLRSPLVLVKNEPGQIDIATTTVAVATVRFPDENAAAGLLIPNQEDTTGVGNWTFVVRLYGAGDINGTDAKDPGQNWTLTVTGEAYELDVKKQTERLGDRVRLTLAPGRGVEYKFEMQLNATMQYRWTASVPVYFDMHGDLFDDPENFTSAKIGTLPQDQGSYVATFYGRHGWYFRNDAQQSITITLETAGDYRILGAV